MVLKTQIIALAFSFLFGIIFAFFVNINYQFLFHKRKIIRILITFLFILDMALLYFFILKWINHGILHPYFLIMIFLGFYISYPFGHIFRGK